MPLRDHFHPPLPPTFFWTSFHARWASAITDSLNERLPDTYNAQVQAQFNVEIDIATFDLQANGHAGPATASPAAEPIWTPQEPVQTLPVVRTTDVVEVLVFSRDVVPRLVGAIELLSPANKDRPESRAAFVAKCVAILEGGAGLILVDVVTSRASNFHAEVAARFTGSDVPGEPGLLYAGAYRPLARPEGPPVLQVWFERLQLGQPLPTMPLWLAGGLVFPVDLNATYEETARRLRLPPE